MPSPFPGMDPYLEAPAIWPDFHDALAAQLRAELNRTLPSPYYARLETRPEVGVVEEAGSSRRIVPDVAVVRRPADGSAAVAVAVPDAPRTVVSPSVEVVVRSEALRHTFVEIRDPSRAHRLVTLIEIVSPSNKRRGLDRQSYAQKQREVLDSDANLVEIDLLRGGQRILANAELEELVGRLEPTPDYLVLVNRAWRRSGGLTAFQLFPIQLIDPLPCVGMPLREHEEPVPLDLQFAFNRAYDDGPYRRGAVNYAAPPDPPLPGESAAWAGERLRQVGLAAGGAS